MKICFFNEDLVCGKPNIDVDNESFIEVDAYIPIKNMFKQQT